MRKLRLKNDGEGFYHVGSRCVDRTFRFNDDDKTHIVDQMRRMATFCGIEINTYVVMTNHFHILVHVLPKGELTDDELVTRVAALYGHDKAEEFRSGWAAYRQDGGAVATAYRITRIALGIGFYYVVQYKVSVIRTVTGRCLFSGV